MHAVDSSSIEAIGYESGSRKLYIRFLQSRKTYVYYGVEKRVFQQFMQAESKGRYLNAAIKGCYAYDRVRRPAIVAPNESGF